MSDYCKNKDPLINAGDISSMAEMRYWILLNLGSPVICIELSEDQMNAVILDCVRWVQKYYLDIGSIDDYMAFQLVPGMTHYKICDDLESIVDFELGGMLGNLNDLFVSNSLALGNVANTYTYSGTCWGTRAGYGDILGNWNSSLIWLKELKLTFGESYRVKYNKLEKELVIYPTPTAPVTGLMRVFKKQKTTKIFNDPLFREMVITKCGMIWSNALRKFNISLTGGGTLNADSMYSSFKERYDAAVERIDQESTFCEFYIG